MRAGALMLCGVALAATTYVVLRGRGELTPALTEGLTPAGTTPPTLVAVNIPFEDARPNPALAGRTSTFIWSSGRLLPVSMTPTPFIMMLVSPPPPMRAGSPVVVTPGASDASAVKLRLAIGKFSTSLVDTVNDRSPLCDWTSGISALTSTVSVRPPTSIVNVPADIRRPHRPRPDPDSDRAN